MKRRIVWFFWAACFFLFVPGIRAMTVDDLINQATHNYAQVKDYTCVMHRKERIGEKIKEQNNIQVKFMKPLKIYLKWTEGDFAGAESIFVQGGYNGKLRFHFGGFRRFIKVALDPRGSLAMRNNRHSIEESHMGNILDLIKDNIRQAREKNSGSITFVKNELLEGRKTLIYKAVFPENMGFYGGEIHVYVDEEFVLPIKIEVFGWKGEILEMYHYSQLKTNVGLTDQDFDIRNPAYSF